MADALGCSGAEAGATPEKRAAAPGTPSTGEGAVRDTERQEAEDWGMVGEGDEDAVSSDFSSDEEGVAIPGEEEEEEEYEEEEELDEEARAARDTEAARDAEASRRMKILNFVEQCQQLRAKTQGSREAAPSAGAQDGDAKAADAGEAGDAAAASEAAEEKPQGGAAREAMVAKLKRLQAMMESAKAAEDPEKEQQDAYIAGAESYDAGDFGAAVQSFGKALRFKPDDVDTWSRRGQAKAKLGDFEGAQADLSEALRRDKDRADLWFLRGSMRSDAGDDDGAMADFEESLSRDAGQPDVYCCRGTLRLERGDNQGAADDCSAVLDLDPSYAGAWGLRGAARQRLGEHEGAAQDCEKALQLDPELEWVRPTLEAARKAAEAGARESAEAGQSTRWRVYGNNLFKEGSLREAVSAYRAAVENREEDWVLALSNQALCHLRLGEHAEAVEAADRCLLEEGAPVKVHFTKFKALAAKREWDRAFAALGALRATPGLPAEIAALADDEERAKRREQAAEASIEAA